MSVLTKTLYLASGDLSVYQVNIDAGEAKLVDGPVYVSQGSQSGLIGSYVRDPQFFTATKIDTGTYATVVLFSPRLNRNTVSYITLSTIFTDVSHSGWTVDSSPENGEIRTEDSNVHAIIKAFPQFEPDYEYDNYANSVFDSNYLVSDISNFSSNYYDLSDQAIELNSQSTWSVQTNLAVVFKPSGNGVRYISFDQVQIFYNSIEPSVPRNVVGSGGDSFIDINWQAPLDDGGDDITGYLIQYSDLNELPSSWTTINSSSTDTFYSVSDLINDNPYIFRVAAINAAGTGNYSDVSSTIYPEEPKRVTAANFNDANYTRIRLRRDTAANWSEVNPILALGEAGYETDTRLLKVGDNNSDWNELGYVKVENSSINFPDPPDAILVIGDSNVLEIDSPRVSCNLSNGEILDLIGGDGISLDYDNNKKTIRFSLDDSFSAFVNDTVVSPSGQGTAGQIYYDSDYVYMCVGQNNWKRIEITPENWFGFEQTSISNDQGLYPSVTKISSSGTQIKIISDGDPYPAKASNNLVNDGVTDRDVFYESYSIQDQSYDFNFKYRGGTATSSPQYAISGINGVFNNGVVFSSPDTLADSIGSFDPPEGFHYHRVFFATYFKLDNCGGFANYPNRYIYCHGKFLTNCWDSKVYESNSYYGGSNYLGDYYRHADGHSKILGFCFDGYPIYGPFGYTDPEIISNGVSLMTSSYLLKNNDDHRPTDWKFTRGINVNGIDYVLNAGAFIEDYEYSENEGTLDQYNGRYAITPEYPNGTYAYYLTFTDSSLVIPKYPYIIGNYSKQQRQV